MPPTEAKQGRWSRLPTWAQWTLGVIAALILLSIGSAIGSKDEGKVKSELTRVEAERNSAERQRDAAKLAARAVVSRKEDILSSARSEAEGIVGKARAEHASAKSTLTQLKSEVELTRGELEDIEGSLGGAEEEQALSTIPGSGIFKAEVDYLPGTYRAPGGATCYWATLNSADPYDIASNENGTGPQIASIESPYFQTKGCGNWERISE